MKRACLLPLLILAASGSARATQAMRHPMSDSVQADLKGPVKRVEFFTSPTSTTPYRIQEFDEHGGLVRRSLTSPVGRGSATRTIEYDASFRPVHVQEVGTLEASGAKHKTSTTFDYRYTDSGCEVKETDDLGLITMKWVTQYDTKGRKLKKTSDHTARTYEYDQLGRLVKDSAGTKESPDVDLRKYDKAGNLISIQFDDAKDKLHSLETFSDTKVDRYRNWIEQTDEVTGNMGSEPIKRKAHIYRHITYYDK